MSASEPLHRVVAGARASSPRERAAFGVLTSFAATIGVSRTINYVLERRRPFPRLRSLARHTASVPRRSESRVHHFLPGMAIAFAAGGTGIFTHQRAFSLSLPFGSGVGLTLDELPLLLEQNNPYWSSERFALAQAAVAIGAAAVLAARFYRHGAAPPGR